MDLANVSLVFITVNMNIIIINDLILISKLIKI